MGGNVVLLSLPWITLKQFNISPEDINYVISTHGHSDHIGNNNLFLNAKHIVGFSVSYKETYFPHSFTEDNPFIINEKIEVIPTPGHTMSDVSVIVKIANVTYAVAGDLFEHGDDIKNPNLWMDAGSESPEEQRKNRYKIALLSDYIIPGHGPMFQCSDEIRQILQSQLSNYSQGGTKLL